MQTKILILIFIVIVFIFGGLLYLYNPDPVEYKNPNEPQPVVCTADAKLCPDGSYVGRTGPNCEFQCPAVPDVKASTTPAKPGKETPPKQPADKPTTPEPVFCTMDAKLCPDGSYVGRTGPNCEFTPCPTSPSQ